MPKLPSSPEEFVDLLLHSSYSMNYRFTIRECNETAVVSATDLMISMLIDDQNIHFYGFIILRRFTRKYKSWVLVNSTRLTKYSKHGFINNGFSISSRRGYSTYIFNY